MSKTLDRSSHCIPVGVARNCLHQMLRFTRPSSYWGTSTQSASGANGGPLSSVPLGGIQALRSCSCTVSSSIVTSAHPLSQHIRPRRPIDPPPFRRHHHHSRLGPATTPAACCSSWPQQHCRPTNVPPSAVVRSNLDSLLTGSVSRRR